MPNIPAFDIVDIPELVESDLTTRTVGGTGIFDGMMVAVSAHLTEEFEKGRITGAQYAEVYLGALNATMGNAVQYLLSREQSRWQAIETQARAQLAHAQVETAKLNLEEMLPAQIAQVVYQNDFLLPAQLIDLQQQTSLKDAQEDQVRAETAAVLPAQVLKLTAETALTDIQRTGLIPAQIAGHTADTVGKTYTNDFILPANLDSIREQTEAHRAKTLNTRSDGTTTVAGAMGIQKELYQQQIASYQRDAENKVVKMLIDTWITQKTMDEGLTPPTSIQDTAINSAVNGLRSNLSL